MGVFFDTGSTSNAITLNDFLGNNPLGLSQAFDSGGSNIFKTSFWSDGNFGQSYLIDGPANTTDPSPSPTSLNLPPNQHLTSPFILYPNGVEEVNGIKYIHWVPSFSSLDYSVTYSVYYSADRWTFMESPSVWFNYKPVLMEYDSFT